MNDNKIRIAGSENREILSGTTYRLNLRCGCFFGLLLFLPPTSTDGFPSAILHVPHMRRLERLFFD